MRTPKLIKICGLNNVHNLTEIEKLNPDFVGFIFHPASPRMVNESLLNYLKCNTKINSKRVGVFVNADIETILSHANTFGLEYIQLHGNESNEMARIIYYNQLKVIKAVSIKNTIPINYLKSFKDYVEIFLLDTYTASYGGSGNAFDWNVLNDYTLDKPFFLSGGLGMNNISEAINLCHPQLVGFDINSKIEIKPGEKDISQTEKIIKKIRL